MKFTKITGTFLNFQSGQRLETGTQYSSQDTRLEKHQIVIHTYENGKIIGTYLNLEGTDFLDFTSKSDDPRIPIISGRFLNTDYEDTILNASLPDKGITISGVVTKLDQTHAVSTKTLIDASGKIVGIMQEKVELITESMFNAGIKKTP